MPFFTGPEELKLELAYARATGRQDAPILSRMLHRSEAFSKGYGTHLPLLVAVVAQAGRGDVLEVGCGHSSTPVLAELCRAMGRGFRSVDCDAKWAQAHTDLGVDVEFTETWSGWAPEGRYAVAFVDNGPEPHEDRDRNLSRAENVRRIRSHAEFVVVHDTRNPKYLVGMEELLDSFAFRFDYGHMAPVTTVVSDVRAYAGALR